MGSADLSAVMVARISLVFCCTEMFFDSKRFASHLHEKIVVRHSPRKGV
jgi:hypothetical protein